MATKPPTSNPPMDQMMMKSLGGPSAVDLRCDRILPWKVHSQHTPATNHPTRCAAPNSYATLPYPIGRKEHSLYKLYTYMSMHIVNVGRKNCKGLESLEFEGPHPSHPQKSLSASGQMYLYWLKEHIPDPYWPIHILWVVKSWLSASTKSWTSDHLGGSIAIYGGFLKRGYP